MSQPANQSVTVGQSATFSIIANGTAPLTYVWRRSGTVIVGAGAASYTIARAGTADNGARYSATVSNARGVATSISATLTVDAASIAPGITLQPQPAVVNAGQTATFTVAANGTAPLVYQWQRNGSSIGGATAAHYTTPATSNSDNGATFAVAIRNSAGTVTSLAAKLTVEVYPALVIATSILPNGVVGMAYSARATTSGGTGPYAWLVQNGQLPAGLALAESSGVISGTPTAAETSKLILSVHDGTGAAATVPTSITIGAAPAQAPFGHVVVVVEENANYSSVVGNAAMPYLNSLIQDYGLATQYYSNAHPSIGNYMMLVTGQVLTTADSQTPASFPVAVDNVVRQLSANGKTWKGYAENLPPPGQRGVDLGNYLVRHVPFAYLTDVQDSPSGSQNLVPFTQFAADRTAGRLPQYAFVTPNACDDAHACQLNVADRWLKTNISPLLASTPFKNDGLLIIVFDESSNDNSHGGGRVVAVVISPAFSKAGHQSTALYQHPSTLRLTLEGLGIKSLPGAAATAPAMWEFFNFQPPL